MNHQIISEMLALVKKNGNLVSHRFNKFWSYNRLDNSLFALSSSLFILQNSAHYLSIADKVLFLDFQKFVTNYYVNYKTNLTYNFYPTNPSRHFDNGYLMKYFRHFKLPDDIDDTALVYLTQNLQTQQSEKLKEYTEGFSEVINSLQTPNKAIKIYNTWYGKNMPKEQDVCALLNFMYFVFSHKLPLKTIDNNTLKFLENQIGQIASNPFVIARHYGNPSLILYHYARFMYVFSVPELDKHKTTLINLTLEELKKETVFLNKIILETALIKWGLKREKIEIDLNSSEWSKNFYSFIGAPLGPFSNRFTKYLASKTWTQIFWKSKVHELSLILEYQVLVNSN